MSFWDSTETANLYKKLFFDEGVPLGKNINVITSLNPNNSCPQDLTNFIKTDNYLISMTKNGYLILFSKKFENRELSSTYRGLTRKFNVLGDPMLSNKKIVNKINKECDFPDDGYYIYNDCDLTELGLYFSGLNEITNRDKTNIYQRGGYKFFFTNKQIKEFNNEMHLNVKKKQQINRSAHNL